MKRFLVSTFASLALTAGLYAHTPSQLQDLNGTWTVRMDRVIDGRIGDDDDINCKLSISSDDKAFRGVFKGCMEGVVIDGNIYDNQLVLAVQYKADDINSYCTFSGKISPDGAIRGTYYSATQSGDFEWVNTGIADNSQTKPKASPTSQPANNPVFVPKDSKKAGTGGKPVVITTPSDKEVVTEFGEKTQTAVVEAPPAPNANTVYHTVEEEENLYRIRKKYNLTTKKILWLNNKTSDRLDVGERLRVSE